MNRQDLVNFWQELPDGGYIHPADQPVMDGNSHNLERDHVPTPWSGPILNARIFLLYTNAGISKENDLVNPDWEQSQRDYENILRENLNGVTTNYTFTEGYRERDGGANWLESRLRHVFSNDQIIQNIIIRNLVAVLDLVAYRSSTFNDDHIINALTSSRAILATVHDELLPLAERGEIFVACMRRYRNWGILPRAGNNIAVGDNQGGYATANTAIGKRIQNFAQQHRII